MASRLCALGSYAAQCMRGALRLGIQKTLAWCSCIKGYIIATILTTMVRKPRRTAWTRLLPLPPTSSPTTSWRSSSQTLPLPGPSSP
jgi:hypothetical protein